VIAILDVDGTLVDTNYHHTIAWYRALRQHAQHVAVWRIHRHIGMGGDKLVGAVCGEEVEAELGDAIRAAEGPLYMAMIDEVEPLAGARALIGALGELGHRVVLASSAKAPELERYLDLLDARSLVDAWTSSADVEATKPDPDLVHAALAAVDGEPADAVMVGDTPWDVEAARRAGVPTVAVLTGGFSEAELREAGAIAVFDSIEALREGLGQTPLGAARVGARAIAPSGR
jgi:HAD superfamily hydrolase (TIGR01509 family)